MNTQTKYYDLYDDMRIRQRWHLRMPVDTQGEWIDTWQFHEGRVLDIPGPIRFPVRPTGVVLEYTLSMGIPVVHRRAWFILNTLQVIRAVPERVL